MSDEHQNTPAPEVTNDDSALVAISDPFGSALLPVEAMDPTVLLTRYAAHPYAISYAKRLAGALAQAGMMPKSFKGNAAAMTVAILHGAKLGLDPLQSAQGIANINGVPSVWGDTLLGLFQRAGGQVEETVPQEYGPGAVATCTATFPGRSPITRSFTYEDALLARLHGKDGPWVTYPKRMMQMRARALAIRDLASDVTKGLAIAEELIGNDEEIAEARSITVLPRSTKPAEPKPVELPDPTQAPRKTAVQTAADEATAFYEQKAKEREAEKAAAPRPEPTAQVAETLSDSPLEDALAAALGSEPDLIETILARATRHDAKLHTTKAQKPRSAEQGDIWIRERDASVHIYGVAGDGTPDWLEITLDPAPETAVEQEEPLLDPKELDPDVPTADGEPEDIPADPPPANAKQAAKAKASDDSWKPKPAKWKNYVIAMKPPQASASVVWIRTEGAHPGAAYAFEATANTWRPSGPAATDAQAMIVARWEGTENQLDAVCGGNWKTCSILDLEKAVRRSAAN